MVMVMIFECKIEKDLWEHCVLVEANSEREAKDKFSDMAEKRKGLVLVRRAAKHEGLPKVDPCTCGSFPEFKWSRGKVGIFCGSCGQSTVLLDRVSFAELHWAVKTGGLRGKYFNGRRVPADD